MHIISALGLRELFSSRTSVDHHAHPLVCAHHTLETSDLRVRHWSVCENLQAKWVGEIFEVEKNEWNASRKGK
jgi:hypothetical protein